METVHINLAAPYEASMGGSLYLIMLVDSASGWMRQYGMKNKSGYGVREEVRPRHDSHEAAEVLPLRRQRRIHQQKLRRLLRLQLGSAESTWPRASRNRTRWWRVRYGAR